MGLHGVRDYSSTPLLGGTVPWLNVQSNPSQACCHAKAPVGLRTRQRGNHAGVYVEGWRAPGDLLFLFVARRGVDLMIRIQSSDAFVDRCLDQKVPTPIWHPASEAPMGRGVLKRCTLLYLCQSARYRPSTWGSFGTRNHVGTAWILGSPRSWAAFCG